MHRVVARRILKPPLLQLLWCPLSTMETIWHFSKFTFIAEDRTVYSLTMVWLTISQLSVQFSSVHSVVSDSLRPHESQHARPPCPSQTPGVYSNSCLSSLWCHPAISSSVVPFSSCPQSLLASGSFPMRQHFAWGGQSTGVSASASVLPTNTQDWSPLGWTDSISLQSKGLSRGFSNILRSNAAAAAKSLQSCPTLSDPMECTRLLHPWDFPGKSTGVGCHCLLLSCRVHHEKRWAGRSISSNQDCQEKYK